MEMLIDFLLKKYINSNSPTPLYLQIKQGIAAAIDENRLEHGTMLPSERSLSQQLGVSRATVVKALSLLMAEDKIIKKQGKGTIINKPIEFSLLKGGFYSQLQGSGKVTSQWLARELIKANDHLSQLLGIDIGGLVSRLKRIRQLNDEPISLETIYVKQQYLPRPERFNGSLYKYWQQNNIIPYSHEYELSVYQPSEEEKIMLEVRKNIPLIKICFTTYNSNSDILEAGYMICHSDFYKFKFKIQANNLHSQR